LEQLVRVHRDGGRSCTLAVRRTRLYADIASESGRLRFVDRRHVNAPGFTFVGAACFERDLLATIPEFAPLGLTEGLLHSVIDEQQATLFEHPGYAHDTGTLQNYLEASIDMLAPDEDIVDAPGTVSTDGGNGHYVGPGARVETGSLGRGAIILSGAEVGPGSKVERCIVWPNSRVPGGLHLRNGIWFNDGLIGVASF
jgi:NDP-sugar pyrophosphorylase family protein